MAELGELAGEQTPLLADLRAAAPQLNRLAVNLPAFNDATRGLARQPRRRGGGRRSARCARARDEIAQLKRAGRKAPAVAELLADFLADLDDPGRAVEVDARAAEGHGPRRARPVTRASRACSTTPTTRRARSTSSTRRATCSTSASSRHDRAVRRTSTPAATRRARRSRPIRTARRTTSSRPRTCVSWLGPNQPRLAAPTRTSSLPPYDPSVCPRAATPPELCDPAGASTGGRTTRRRGGGSVATGRGRRRRRRRDRAGRAAVERAAPGRPDPGRRCPRASRTTSSIRPTSPQLPGLDGLRRDRTATAAARVGSRAGPPRLPVRELMRGRGPLQSLAALADDGRRGHDPDRDRRRLPRLQREPGPALRAHLPRLGRDPERLAPDQQQRGPDRRHTASASSSRSRRSTRGESQAATSADRVDRRGRRERRAGRGRSPAST